MCRAVEDADEVGWLLARRRGHAGVLRTIAHGALTTTVRVHGAFPSAVLTPIPPGRRRFGVLAAGAFFGHAIYPVIVQAASRLVAAPPRHPGSFPGRWADAVIPAYRERATVGPLVSRLLSDPDSPVAKVIVVVDDDEPTAEAAEAAGARVLRGPRRGKAAALNRGMAAATADVVLLLDANVSVEGRSIRRLAEWVRAGQHDLVGGVRTEHGHAGESMYWAFENWTKSAEHRLGGSPAVVGELLCLRRSAFRPIPEWVRVDDLFLAVDIGSRRRGVTVDVTCVSSEPSASPRQQLERRLRMMEALLELLVRHPRPFLTPTRSVLLLHGHRTWRSTIGPACQVALAVASARRIRCSPLAAAWLALNVAAAADYLIGSLRNRTPTGRLRPLAAQGLGMPPVIALGAAGRLAIRLVSGRRDGTWARVER